MERIRQKRLQFDVSAFPTATTKTLPFSTTAGGLGGTNIQIWDADLDALAALSGTNTLYYRSAANTWSPVTIGGNMTFSGGTLDAASGGGGTAATFAQAISGQSNSVYVTPANIAGAVFGMSWRAGGVVNGSTITDLGTAAGSGTGASSGGNNALDISSGATASSWREADSGASIDGLNPSTSALTAGMNFAKPCGFTESFRFTAGTTNGVCRFSLTQTLAANGSGNTGKLAGKGIGFEIRNATIYGAVHDGTTYNSASLSVTCTVNAHYLVQCFSDGAGNANFYVNGVFKATVTGAPTTATTSHVTKLCAAVDNGGDAANQEFQVGDYKLFQGL